MEIAVAMGFVESGVTREEFARQFLAACDWDDDKRSTGTSFGKPL